MPKNREANELRARADALRAKLGDADIQLTPDEVAQHVEGIKAYEVRAAAMAEFTPEAEIERQGGDEVLRQAAPDSDDGDTQRVVSKYQQWSKDTVRAFGGRVEAYIRAVTHRPSYEGMTPEQRQVVQRGKRLSLATFGREDLELRGAIIGTASDASGGEYLLPLQQDPSIFQVENMQIGMLQRATRYPVTGRTLRIPYVIQTDGANTRPMAGIAAVAIVGEGAAKGEREPKFLQRLLTVYKWGAYSKIGDEILADDLTGDLAPTVTRLVGGQVMNEMNDYFTVVGSGTSQPLGALHANNNALLVVNRETSQAVTSGDVFKIWSRHTHGAGSYWSCSRRVIEKLFGMTLGSNTLVTFIQNLNGAPQFSLLGYPVVISDLQPTLGVQGDLALINPAFYAVAVRTQLTVESSIHVEFINDMTTYRFFARGGGVPIPDETYAYKASGGNKIDEHSPFTVLGDDITS
jgi:HK97 family phage major capsid protein